MNADTVWAVASFCDTETALNLISLDKHLLGAFVKERAGLKRRQRFEEARRRVAEHVGELPHRVCNYIGTNLMRTDYTIITKTFTVVVHRYVHEGLSWEVVAMLAELTFFERFFAWDLYVISCKRGISYENGVDYPYCYTRAYLTDAMIAHAESLL